MWVKICGTTTLEDARCAVDAGADALGFVLAPSPREVTPAQVAVITTRLPLQVERFGVFVHPTFEQVVAAVGTAGLSGVQIHATDDPSLAPRLRAHFSAIPGRRRLGLVRVLHLPVDGAVRPSEIEAELETLATDHSLDAVLLDARTATAIGGTGLRFDWAAASGTVLRGAPHLRVIAAGGLAPDNVAEAVAMLRPWGVDVVTGVEAAPGRKDPEKVRAFVARARAAAQAMLAPAPVRA